VLENYSLLTMSLVEQRTQVATLVKGMKDKKAAAGALGSLLELAKKPELESLLVGALPDVLEAIGSKDKPAQVAAKEVLEAVQSNIPAWSAAHVVPFLMTGMSGSMKPVRTGVSLPAFLLSFSALPSSSASLPSCCPFPCRCSRRRASRRLRGSRRARRRRWAGSSWS